MTSTSARVLSESLHKLQLGDTKAAKDAAVVDSWEDDAEDEVNTSSQVASPVIEIPATPPTSPISPSVRTKATSKESPFQTFPPFGMDTAEPESRAAPAASRARTDPDKRPEKTTSAAARLIAAGIGQRPVRRTQEEREYDQAMKVQEKKRRDAARDEAARVELDKAKAKQAIWDD